MFKIMKKTIVLFTVLTLLLSCTTQTKIEYKYQDKPQNVTCTGVDKLLMHEALYSFQEDIDEFFKNKGTGEKNITRAYASYIYRGTMGTAQFGMISSKHSRDILKKLQQLGDLFVKKNNKTTLNFNNQYVKCLVDGIKNEEIKRILKSLQQVNDMRVELLVEPYRKNVRDVHIDQNFAMLVALQTYYAHLADADLSNLDKNPKSETKTSTKTN